jgi:hypothetical protein
MPRRWCSAARWCREENHRSTGHPVAAGPPHRHRPYPRGQPTRRFFHRSDRQEETCAHAPRQVGRSRVRYARRSRSGVYLSPGAW